MHSCRIVAVMSSLLVSAAPALAGSDYLLQLDPVKGEGKDAPAAQTIEVQSFSWGASNPGAAATGGGAGAGKVSMQDLSVISVQAPRDVSTGMATGKRAAISDGQPVSTVAPKVGDVATFTVVTRDSPSTPAGQAGACATGTHFPQAVLVARGQRYEFSDVVVTSCTVADGQTRKNYTGHVTLMK
jgi:hypothetical protein